MKFKKINSQSSFKPPQTSQQASRKLFDHPQKDNIKQGLTNNPSASLHGLKFDANFECGNMETVREREPNVYDITIRNDSNSNGHVQWFYFRVTTPTVFKMQSQVFKFNILNLTKRDSLFDQGMKLTLLSKKSNHGWVYGGFNISYTKSPISGDICYLNQRQQQYFCLSFDYKFEHADDEVFFATTLPYTYSNMQRHLLSLNQLKELKEYQMFEITSVGKSNGKLDMPLVKIRSAANKNIKGEVMKQDEEKPVIFIIGRQHPGETLSSFIIHGLINYLLTPNQAVQQLREMFEFWIMPIANPDGVVLGNYRCNLQGKDLNRCFQYFNDEEYGGTYSSVKECESIQEYLNANIFAQSKLFGKKTSFNTNNASFVLQGGEPRIKLFLDIHTHSSQRGIFTYAPCAQISEQMKIRQFPQILDDISQYFRLASCKYQSEKAKKNCARLAFIRDYKAEYSYTIETSSYAYVEKKTNQTFQLKDSDLMMFGKQIIMALAKLFLIDPHNGPVASPNSPHLDVKSPDHQQFSTACEFSQSTTRFLGYNMPLDFGLRMQWKPNQVDFQKMSKQVIAKFSQSKFNNGKIKNGTTIRGAIFNEAVLDKKGNTNQNAGSGMKICISQARIQHQRLSDSSNYQTQKQTNLFPPADISLLDISAQATMKNQHNLFAPTKTLHQSKDPVRQIKSSVFQMNYVGDNFIFPSEEFNQVISTNHTSTSSATNDFLTKFLKSKESKNYLNDNIYKKQARQQQNKSNLIAYSQKQRHYNATETAQAISGIKSSEVFFEQEMSPAILLLEATENSTNLINTAKSREYLSSQIKKIQNHKLEKQKNNGKSRFANLQQNSAVLMSETPQSSSPTFKHSTHTFRPDSIFVNAFPELSQISQSPLQMIVPAKIHQKNYIAYKPSKEKAQPTDRINCGGVSKKILLANPSIGEHSIEDDASFDSSSSNCKIDMKIVNGESNSQSQKNNFTMRFNRNFKEINRQNTQSEINDTSKRNVGQHPILKTINQGSYAPKTDQLSSKNVKTKIEQPQTGQLYSKLELIEQKSKDFKNYLKIQLEEVHENHMKEKYPYQRPGSIPQHHISSEQVRLPSQPVNQINKHTSRFEIADTQKIVTPDMINHSYFPSNSGNIHYKYHQDDASQNCVASILKVSDNAVSKNYVSHNALQNNKIDNISSQIDFNERIQNLKSKSLKVPRVMIETLQKTNNIYSAAISSAEILISPISTSQYTVPTMNRKSEDEAHGGVIDAIKLQNLHKKQVANQQRPRKPNANDMKSQPLFQTQNTNNAVANIVYNMAIDEQPSNLQTDPYRMVGSKGGISLLSMTGIKKEQQIAQMQSPQKQLQMLIKVPPNKPNVATTTNKQEMVQGKGLKPSPVKKQTQQSNIINEANRVSNVNENQQQQRKMLNPA